MPLARLLTTLLLCTLCLDAGAGYKTLIVAFFDYSDAGVGKASFKALRASSYEHDCWQRFVEIQGIDTAYVDQLPKSLDKALLLEAVHGSRPATERFSKALQAEGLNGAYAFVQDATGRYATILGINYQDGAVSSSASFRTPASGPIPKAVLSKALCEASRAMD